MQEELYNMFEVTQIFRYDPVFSEENEALNELEEIDFLQLVSDAVASGELTDAEAIAMVVREDELNAVR